MRCRTIIFGLFTLLIAVSTAPAQNINIHTAEGTSSFDLAEVDSITFGDIEEPDPDVERDFELTEDMMILMVGRAAVFTPRKLMATLKLTS